MRTMTMNLNESLYREHLEELSVLYDQRLMLMNTQALKWYEFIDVEQRMEPHIDALVIGGDQALYVCRERALEGDCGEAHGAVRVIARHRQLKMLEKSVVSMDVSRPELLDAVSDALCQELPVACAGDFIHFLMDLGPNPIRLACKIIGFRRLDAASELFDVLYRYPHEKALMLDVLHALGRIRPRFGLEHLLSLLHSKDKDLVNSAVTALIRIGERQALEECMAFIGPGDWPKLSLGLYGGEGILTDSFFSVSGLDDPGPSSWDLDHVTAAGLLGNIRLIPGLIGRLNRPELSERAALALFMITGADLEETVFIPEEIDPDELFDDERVLWEKGQLYPPGITVTRISQNPDQWSDWWLKNRFRFDEETRYRNGKPYSPLCLLENIRSRQSPELVRTLAHDELVIRYGIDIPFETHMTVSRQMEMLESLMLRLSGNPDRFVAGLWYFNGKPLGRMDRADAVS